MDVHQKKPEEISQKDWQYAKESTCVLQSQWLFFNVTSYYVIIIIVGMYWCIS